MSVKLWPPTPERDESLELVVSTYQQYLLLPDLGPLEVILATVIANFRKLFNGK